LVFAAPAAAAPEAYQIFLGPVARSNATQMTDEERAVVAAWVSAGAPAK